MYGVNNGGAYPYGVVGAVTSAPGFGLFGVATASGTVGFAGGATNGAIAGQFSGPVNIYNGPLTILGNYVATGTKSAAVPHPDGSHRLLYCMESPEAWFEDFGTGTLSGGKADVKLDADFAAVVDTKNLHVFLTPHDEAHQLAVKTRSGNGFSVAASVSADASARGMKATDASGTFTYRVVAKRKDVQADRLAKFTVPQEIKGLPRFPKFPPAPAHEGVIPFHAMYCPGSLPLFIAPSSVSATGFLRHCKWLQVAKWQGVRVLAVNPPNPPLPKGHPLPASGRGAKPRRTGAYPPHRDL